MKRAPGKYDFTHLENIFFLPFFIHFFLENNRGTFATGEPTDRNNYPGALQRARLVLWRTQTSDGGL